MPADYANKFPHKDLSYEIRGLLFKVQNDLGTKFQEKHYCRALVSLLKQNQIRFRQEVPIKIFYQNELLGNFRLDFLIENKIILEFKTTDCLTAEHRQQMIRYLEASNIPVGFIVNFRKRPLEIRRVVLSHLRNQRPKASA